eukprot:5495717-Pleurochrysis_carterae.AAC.2
MPVEVAIAASARRNVGRIVAQNCRGPRWVYPCVHGAPARPRVQHASAADDPLKSGERAPAVAGAGRVPLGRRLGRRGGSARLGSRRWRRSFRGQRGSGVDLLVRGAEARRVQSTEDSGEEETPPQCVRAFGAGSGDWRATVAPERVAARQAALCISEAALRARKIGIIHDSLAVRGESVPEAKENKLLDATQGEQCIGVGVCRLGGDGFALGATIG